MTFGPQAATVPRAGKVYRIGWLGPNYGIYHEVFLKEFRRIARPGGNLTGLSNNIREIGGKVLQLLNEAVPGASRLAYLWNPDLDRIARLALEEIQTAANALDVDLQSVKVRHAEDFEPAFSSMINKQDQALVVLAGPLMIENTAQIVDLSLKNRLPLMVNGSSTWVQNGALLSYTPPYSPQFRRAAHLIDKILKGGNPGAKPVEHPKIYDFAINLKRLPGSL